MSKTEKDICSNCGEPTRDYDFLYIQGQHIIIDQRSGEIVATSFDFINWDFKEGEK